jgi:hypothetical protein
MVPGKHQYGGRISSGTLHYRSIDRHFLHMIDRLRTLSPAWRYPLYVVCMLVLFSSALGVGAMAALLIDWQFAGTRAGPGEMSALEGGKLETTGIARSLESPATPPSTESGPDESDYEADFVHKATAANSRGDYTYISDPRINGDPNAVVMVTLMSSQKSGESGTYNHHIGVWYEPGARRWAIFNQDRTAVPAGTTFRVGVPQASQTIVHHAKPSNGDGNYTYLDNKLTNGEPNATLSITQNWNPGGGRGVYNDHPVGAVYDPKLEAWAIDNRDGSQMPIGAAFNIAVSTDADEPAK